MDTLTFDDRIRERARKIFSYGANYKKGLATLCSYPWFEFGNELKSFVEVQNIQDIKGE